MALCYRNIQNDKDNPLNEIHADAVLPYILYSAEEWLNGKQIQTIQTRKKDLTI